MYMFAAPCRKMPALYDHCISSTFVQFVKSLVPSKTLPSFVPPIRPTDSTQSHVFSAISAYVWLPVYTASRVARLNMAPLLMLFL